MKYLCLVYQDETSAHDLAESDCGMTMDEALEFREELCRSGHYITSSPLQPVDAVTTIRVRNGNVFISVGPFAESKAPLGGFYLIEARDLNDAIRVVSRMPPARNGCVEVRPLREVIVNSPAQG